MSLTARMASSLPAFGRAEEAVDFLQAADAFANGAQIGQRAAEPAVHHIGHPGARGGVFDFLLGLLLGADEQDRAAVENDVMEESAGDFDLGESLVKVNDVNAVACGENELLHLGVPALGLVTEMNPRFHQLCDRYACQCILRCSISRPADFATARDIPSLMTGFWFNVSVFCFRRTV